MKSKLENYKRNCPTCGTEISYKSKGNLDRASKSNCQCVHCSNSSRYGGGIITCGVCGIEFKSSKSNKRKFCSRKCCDIGRDKTGGNRGERWYESMKHVDMGKWRGKVNTGQSERMKGKLPWNTGLTRLTDNRIDEVAQKKQGFKHSDETKEKIRNSKMGVSTPTETKLKMRISHIKYVERKFFNGGQSKPNYNISSIPILEQKAKELGITDLQHAENGGEYYIEELGYWVDGYSKEKNIVIEYYENHHKRQTKKDLQRQQEITNLLKCEFIIINE